MKNQSIDHHLSFAYNAIHNAMTNESISKALAVYGYDDDKLKKGLKMQEKASELYMRQFREKGEQYDATDDVNEAREKLHNVYIKHLKFARIAFRKERGLYQELQMAGKRKLSHTGYLAQVEAFYKNALTNKQVLKGLAEFNLTKDKLEAGFGLFKDMKAKYLKQLKEMGEVQKVTEVKNEAVDELKDWMSDFISVSRIALEDSPQELEILGIVVKS